MSGVRCIHTHPNESGMLSAVDVCSLKALRLDMMAAVGVHKQKPTEIYVAVSSPISVEDVEIFGPYSAEKEDFEALIEYIGEADEFLREQHAETLKNEQEKAILVGIKTQETKNILGVSEADISLIELKELAQAAGAKVVASVIQNRESRDVAFYIGKGKVEAVSYTHLDVYKRQILLESNHDIEMLRTGRYPWPLKQRILGDRGHLCNEMAGQIVAHLAQCGTKRFLLGHLSQENNFPELAYRTVCNALLEKKINPSKDVYLEVALRDRSSNVMYINTGA